MPTEREKMLRGELYDPRDPELAAARRRARDLLHAYNHSREGDAEVRARVVRELFAAAGEGVWIEPPFFCDYGSNIRLGDRVFLNFDCVVLDVAEVVIGSDTLIGPAVQIYTATHPLGAVERRAGLEAAKPVSIGADVWIGGGAILLPGVRVGARSVIAAGSVVTKDVPDGVVAAGNPCRVLRPLE
ncbi:MAG TPA: sugar O-acetyltransferase [Longimicrobium sp.]|nr:sugar O-acetyltransferase [Longimicrobium sp.]